MKNRNISYTLIIHGFQHVNANSIVKILIIFIFGKKKYLYYNSFLLNNMNSPISSLFINNR